MRSTGLVGSLLLSALLLVGCSAGEPSSSDPGPDEDDITGHQISELSLTLYDTVDKFPQVVSYKLRGSNDAKTLARCHRYGTSLDDSQLHLPRIAMVCRDDKLEIAIESTYGDEWTRFARVRFTGGGQEFFACKKQSETPRPGEGWDTKTEQLCKPKKLAEYGKQLFDFLDKPVFEKYPTRTPFLPTMWTKSPPEKWSKYADTFGKALPVGEYTGFSSTSAKKCKVKVAKEGDGIKVSLHSIDDAGAETRLRGQIVVNSAMTFGAARADHVDQDLSGKARAASLVSASSETETSGRDWFQRNLRVVRFEDAPASVDAGHSAVFIDDDYCQRLSPAIPAW